MKRDQPICVCADMVFAALCLTLIQTDPKATLVEAMSHYQTLSAFSMSIQHKDSSGLFPGQYTQSLQWKKGGHFELLVTKPPVFADKDRNSPAPNYFSDGAHIVSIFPNGHQVVKTLETSLNSVPGWDVSGGLILSFLQDTTTAKIIRNEAKEVQLSYAFGPAKEWRRQPVREILASVKSGDAESGPIHLYLDATLPKLLGVTMKMDPKGAEGYMVFENQKENPTLSDSLGKVKSE